MDSVAKTFKLLWRTRQNFTVQDMGGNRVAFVFDDELDLTRVLANEPWSFDKFLMVFKCLVDDVPITDFDFTHLFLGPTTQSPDT